MTLSRFARVPFGVAVMALALLAGCSGKTVGIDLTTKPDPTDPNNPDPNDPSDPKDPPRCTTIAPACDRGDTSFASDLACKGSGAEYCYSRTETCSKLVTWCGRLDAQCDGRPACDPGDTPVTACPGGGPGNNGSFCYTRSACGESILCYHRDTCTALPVCDVGDKQVGDPSQCFQNPPLDCYSRAACGVSITCARP